jgi:CBS domain-containing protein
VSNEYASKSVTDLFHRLNSVLPEDQVVVTVAPEELAVDALKTMEEQGYSQLPITVGDEVLGLFSYRAFAKAVLEHGETVSPAELTVDDCLEEPSFARVTEEFAKWFDFINRNDALLIGEPNRLQGIVTAMDILLYLYKVASPFVLIEEVERSVRELIRLSADPATIAGWATQCLSARYGSPAPTDPDLMMFSDYIKLICHEELWENFRPVFGGDRLRIKAKLNEIRELRNVVFHFEREISVQEYETLVEFRNRMLRQARAAEARRREVTG